MKNKTATIFIIIIVALFAFFMLKESNNASASEKKIREEIKFAELENGVQKVTLSMKNGNYYPKQFKLKEGIPVSITLDKSITGCYRSLTIRNFGIIKYSKNVEDTIDFMPDKKGEYTFSCTMSMASGKMIIE